MSRGSTLLAVSILLLAGLILYFIALPTLAESVLSPSAQMDATQPPTAQIVRTPEILRTPTPRSSSSISTTTVGPLLFDFPTPRVVSDEGPLSGMALSELEQNAMAVVKLNGCIRKNSPQCTYSDGTGVLIHPRGLILTALHVVVEDADELRSPILPEVSVGVLSDLDESAQPEYRATVVAFDPELDFALLWITQPDDQSNLYLPTLPIERISNAEFRMADLTVMGYLHGQSTLKQPKVSYFGLNDEVDAVEIVGPQIRSGFSGGPLLVERDGRYHVGGIVFYRADGPVLVRPIQQLEKLRWHDHSPMRLWTDRSETGTEIAGGLPGLTLSSDIHAIDLAGRELRLIVSAFDSESGQLWPDSDDPFVFRRTFETRRFVDMVRLEGSAPLLGYGPLPERLRFVWQVWDRDESKLLWDDETFYLSRIEHARSDTVPTPTLGFSTQSSSQQGTQTSTIDGHVVSTTVTSEATDRMSQPIATTEASTVVSQGISTATPTITSRTTLRQSDSEWRSLVTDPEEVLNVTSLVELAPFELMRLGRGSVSYVTLAPNNQALAVVTSIGVWLYTPEVSRLLGHVGLVVYPAWSPDGSRLATGSQDGVVHIWDGTDGKIVHTLDGEDQPAFAVSWSPKGGLLASLHVGGTVRIWDAVTGKELRSRTSSDSQFVVWSPDASKIAVASSGMVEIWSSDEVQLLQTLHLPVSTEPFVRWSPDNLRLATSSHERVVRIWDTVSGLELLPLEGHQAQPGMVWSSDGDRIVTVSTDSVRVWDTNRGQELKALTTGNTPGGGFIEISGNGDRVVSTSGDGTLSVWDVDSGQIIQTLKGNESKTVSANWTSEGGRIVGVSESDSIRIWDIESGQSIGVLPSWSVALFGANWYPDGNLIMPSSKLEKALVWDINSSQLMETKSGPISGIQRMIWSPDGTRFASASTDNSVQVWESDTDQVHVDLEGHTDTVTSVVWSSDGKRITSTSADRTLRIWDISSGQELRTIDLTDYNNFDRSELDVYSILSPNGGQIATRFGDHILRILDVGSGMTLDLEPQKGNLTVMAWSSDGSKLASGDHAFVSIWDAMGGEILQFFTGHSRGVTGLSWSPDGSRISSASGDGTLQIWDVNTGHNLRKLAGHAAAVQSVQWSPNAAHLVSLSADGTVRIWDVSDLE